MNKSSSSKIGFLIFSIIILFPGFYTNYWGVVPDVAFTDSLKDTEAHIVGRMVKSRRDGLFSAGGLPGVVKYNDQNKKMSGNKIDIQRRQSDWDKTLPYIDFQYAAFIEQLEFESYSVYLSQSGGQAMFYSSLDQLIPLEPANRLTLFYLINALATAIALSLIVLWFYLEFDFRIAVVILLSLVFSQWLVLFGKNLWWNIWSFYAPMIALMYFLKFNLPESKHFHARLVLIIFATLLIKYMFTGMEYTTTTLVMMMVPFFYYGFLHDYGLKKFFIGFSWSVIASVFTFLFCLLVLSFQIGSVLGTFSDGLDHIMFSLLARTHGGNIDLPEMYIDDVNSSIIDVIIVYLKGAYFDFGNYPNIAKIIPNALVKVRYSYLVVLFLLSSVYLSWSVFRSKPEPENRKIKAVLIATWVAFLAPLSWFIIFKAHSHVHIHLNFILWQMPFTIFGFAIIGITIFKMIKSLMKLIPAH